MHSQPWALHAPRDEAGNRHSSAVYASTSFSHLRTLARPLPLEVHTAAPKSSSVPHTIPRPSPSSVSVDLRVFVAQTLTPASPRENLHYYFTLISRSLGLTEAVRSLEAPTGSETSGDLSSSGDLGVGTGGGGGVASTAACLDVETLPDVPGQVSLVSCKVRDRRPSPYLAVDDSSSSSNSIEAAVCAYWWVRSVSGRGLWLQSRTRTSKCGLALGLLCSALPKPPNADGGEKTARHTIVETFNRTGQCGEHRRNRNEASVDVVRYSFVGTGSAQQISAGPTPQSAGEGTFAFLIQSTTCALLCLLSPAGPHFRLSRRPARSRRCVVASTVAVALPRCRK